MSKVGDFSKFNFTRIMTTILMVPDFSEVINISVLFNVSQ